MRDRITVVRIPLEDVILVRIQVPQQNVHPYPTVVSVYLVKACQTSHFLEIASNSYKSNQLSTFNAWIIIAQSVLLSEFLSKKYEMGLDILLDICYIIFMTDATGIKQLENQIRSDFPKNSFEEALKVAQAIEDSNGGNSIPPQEVAIALKRGPGSSDFRVLLSSSIKYGLTSGSFNSPRVSLTDLGRDIVEPKDDKSRSEAVTISILKPSSFTKVFDYYRGKKVPEKSFFENTVARDFGIPKKQADIFVKIFMANIKHLGAVKDTTTGPWFATDINSPSLQKQTVVLEKEGGVEEGIDASEDNTPPVQVQDLPSKKNSPQKVFISHGNNNEIVEQLKELLVFGKFIPVVAEEHNTTSVPVPEKVLVEMKNCFAGLIHVEGEQKMIDSDGKEQTVLNQNVLIEIGSALALYGKNTILLVEKGTQLPSNLQGLYRCEYEGKKLDYVSTMKLLKTFNELVQL